VDREAHREQQNGRNDSTNDPGAEGNAERQIELVANDKLKIRKIAAY